MNPLADIQTRHHEDQIAAARETEADAQAEAHRAASRARAASLRRVVAEMEAETAGAIEQPTGGPRLTREECLAINERFASHVPAGVTVTARMSGEVSLRGPIVPTVHAIAALAVLEAELVTFTPNTARGDAYAGLRAPES